jgi:predicted phage terminase large subunit-like protein
MGRPADRWKVIQSQKKLLEDEYRRNLRAITARRARDSLLAFTRLTMPDPEDVDDSTRSLYKQAWHLEAICELLEKVERGEVLRAIITLPPRHGKSELASRRFPAWFVGRDPYRQVIFATYGADFAEDFGRKAREIIDLGAYRQVFPAVRLQKQSRAADRMELEAGGMMVFLGVGGPATGRGADLLLIDDPFKNREESESLTHRNKVWDWFTSTAYTRLMPHGRVVVILTRWHEDDMVGRIYNPDFVPKAEADKWFRLDLPALIDEGNANERALWPERYPLEVLRSTRAFIGERDWNALYQQRPTPPEGAFFKQTMIHTYSADELPTVHRPYLTGDLALGTKKMHDETCVGFWMLTEDETLFLHPDLFWERQTADASVERIIDMMKRHQPMTSWWERGQIEKAVGPFLLKRMAERKVFGTHLDALPVAGDKGFRASAIRGRMAMARVKFPRFAPWWPRAKEQLLKFTGSGDDASDDFVDMCSLIGQALGSQLRASTPVANVVNFPASGTLGWVKQQHRVEQREKKRLEARGGF